MARIPWLRKVETAATCIGAALVVVHATARMAAEAARAAGVEAFDESIRPADGEPSAASAGPVEGAPRAVLGIPSLELEIPVYADTGELALSRGAGHIEGTAALGGTGNSGIAAHRDSFFRKLERIELGADVLLRVGPRDRHYRVTSIEIVKPTDVHVLAPTPTPSITLVTCFPFNYVGAAPRRYVVRAELVEAPPLPAPGARADATI